MCVSMFISAHTYAIACHNMHVEVRKKTFGSWFSLSTVMGVSGLKLRPSGLCGKCSFLVSHLSGPLDDRIDYILKNVTN